MHLSIEAGAEGPSSEVFGHGSALRCSSGAMFWDDDLTEAEINVICGVHRHFTGQGSQTEDLSWWPKQTTWQASNFDAGYWSPDNEAWFQRRLTMILSGTARPLNARMWRNQLKRFKATKLVVESYRKAADLFLADIST